VASVTKTFTLKGVQTIRVQGVEGVERWIVFMSLSVNMYIVNSLHYQCKSHGTVTIPGKTRCVLLHCDSSKH
jgi:hypothetical protein